MSLLKRLNRRWLPSHLFYAPEWLVLGVNNVCNLHCKMCDVGQANLETGFAQNLLGSSPMNMPFDLMQRIVQQTSRFYPQTKLGFAFTEPLIYPHLVESIDLARQHELHTAVTTNGLTLESSAPALAEAGLDELFLSLDGPPEVHDLIRGRQGSYARAIAGVEALLNRDQRPSISIFAVITPWNIGRLVEFVQAFIEWPLAHVGLMHPNFNTPEVVTAHNAHFGSSYPATTSNLGPFDPQDVNLDDLLAELQEIDARKWPFPVSMSPPLISRAQLELFYLRPEQLIGSSCSDAARNLMIKSDGSAIPAHGRCYNISVGDLHSQSLPEIWNSSASARFRTTLARAGGLLPACSRCCSAF